MLMSFTFVILMLPILFIDYMIRGKGDSVIGLLCLGCMVFAICCYYNVNLIPRVYRKVDLECIDRGDI